MSKPRIKPHTARCHDGSATEAWWYENAKSIDVYTYHPEKGGMACRIHRKAIEDWLRRTEKK